MTTSSHLMGNFWKGRPSPWHLCPVPGRMSALQAEDSPSHQWWNVCSISGKTRQGREGDVGTAVGRRKRNEGRKNRPAGSNGIKIFIETGMWSSWAWWRHDRFPSGTLCTAGGSCMFPRRYSISGAQLGLLLGPVKSVWAKVW